MNDIFWCTADPGWVTGTSYGIIAPLLHGVTSHRRRGRLRRRALVPHPAGAAGQRLVHGADGDPHADEGRRRTRAAVPLPGAALRRQRRRAAESGGRVVGQEVLGLPIHDNWWQTETGGIMIANTPAFDIKPGSMGEPLPGIDARLMRRAREEHGGIEEVDCEPTSRANWRCASAGRRCSAAI
jgi:acetyl-CoA synthetase